MKLFGRKKERTLEEVIFDIAEKSKESDLLLLRNMLSEREVFVPWNKELPGNAQPGQPYIVGADDQLKWPMTCLVSSRNQFINGNALGIKFAELLEMAKRLKVDGIQVHNGINSWCVIWV